MDVPTALASTGTYLPGNSILPVYLFLKNTVWDFDLRLYPIRGNHHIIASRKTYEIYIGAEVARETWREHGIQIEEKRRNNKYGTIYSWRRRVGERVLLWRGEKFEGLTNEQGDGKSRMDL